MDGTPRFLTRDDVAEILNISTAQVYALVRRGELRAIKIGQRGQWRVERSALEDFIQGRYDDTARFIEAHPLGATDADAEHMVDEAMTAEFATDERDH